MSDLKWWFDPNNSEPFYSHYPDFELGEFTRDDKDNLVVCHPANEAYCKYAIAKGLDVNDTPVRAVPKLPTLLVSHFCPEKSIYTRHNNVWTRLDL